VNFSQIVLPLGVLFRFLLSGLRQRALRSGSFRACVLHPTRRHSRLHPEETPCVLTPKVPGPISAPARLRKCWGGRRHPSSITAPLGRVATVLLLGNHVVKWFRQPAENQLRSCGPCPAHWVECIDNPWRMKRLDRQERLHDAIKNLNRNQKRPGIRHGDGQASACGGKWSANQRQREGEGSQRQRRVAGHPEQGGMGPGEVSPGFPCASPGATTILRSTAPSGTGLWVRHPTQEQDASGTVSSTRKRNG
jgi:hypothetical protein